MNSMSADAAQALTGMHEAAAPSATGFHWSPARDTWVAALSYLAVVAALALAFQVFTVARVAANFITYGVIALAGVGVAFPALYTVLVRKRPLADLGLTTRLVAPSLLLGIILGFDTYRNTVATLEVTWSSARLVFGAVFRLTNNVFVLWPFYTPVGSFYSNLKGGLELPFEATFGFVLVLILMTGSVIAASILHDRRKSRFGAEVR